MVAIRARLATLKGVAYRDMRRAWRLGMMHLGVSHLLVRSTSLAQRILLARILGAENIGHIAVVNSAVNIIRLPAGVGTFTVVNKLVAENSRNPEAQKEVVGTSLWINVVTSLLVCIVAWIVLARTSWVSDSIANVMLRKLLLFLPLIVFTEVLRNALLGQRRMKTVALNDIAVSLIAILVVVPMSILWSLNGWFINKCLTILVGLGLVAWSVRWILSLKWNSAYAHSVAMIGGFAFLGQLVGALMTQFDTLAVSGILGDAATTGTYNTAALVSQQMMVVPGAVLSAVFPFVAQNKGDLARLRQRYWELFRKVGGLASLMAVGTWTVSPWVFALFGHEFAASVAPFRVLVLGFVARSLYVLDNTYLDALGRTDITFASGLVSAALAVGLALWFIPIWGVMGAAWATTLSMVTSAIVRKVAVSYFVFHKQAIR